VNEANADKLAMLLSTDWFFNYWSMIGLIAEDGQRASIQLACRDVVKKMMSGADVYWNVSFSPDRLARTKSDLIDGCMASGADKPLIDCIKTVASDELTSSYDSTSSSMLALMTDQLARAPGADDLFEIDVELKREIQNLWSNDGCSDIDFEQICLSSTDSWDAYTRSLTPDLPMMLADYLSGLLDVIDDRFLSLWSRIVKTMPVQDVSRIRSGYLKAAHKIVDPDFALPMWMTK
jgi:hypothetical protein